MKVNPKKIKGAGMIALINVLPKMNEMQMQALEKQIQDEAQIMLDLIEDERNKRGGKQNE